MSFRDNKKYNHLATEGLVEPLDQDKATVKNQKDEQKEEILDVQENLDFQVTDGNAINYAGLLNVKPPESKPLYKPDKLSDYYKPVKISQEPVAQKLADAYFFFNRKLTTNITRQRQKQVQQAHNIYTKTLTNNPIILWKPVVGNGCYVDGQNSYVKFTFEINADCSFGVGSAANLFKRATFKTKGGDIYNYENIHQINTIRDYWMKENTYVESIEYFSKGYANALTADIEYQILIKLGDLVPIFAINDMLTPEMLNGSEISLELESPTFACQGVAPLDPNLAYQIKDFTIVYDGHFVDSKYIDSIHDLDITINTCAYLTELKTVTGKAKWNLQNDVNKNVKYYICKKLNRKEGDENDWVRDMFEFDIPGGIDEPSSYRWTTGINSYPELPENILENFLHTERVLAPDRRNNDMQSKYLEVLNLSRNRANNDGIVLDDRNQVTYEYNVYSGLPSEFLFVKYYEQSITVEGLPKDYKKNEYALVEVDTVE